MWAGGLACLLWVCRTCPGGRLGMGSNLEAAPTARLGQSSRSQLRRSMTLANRRRYVALYAQAAEQAGKATCTTVTGFDADPHAAGAAARVLSEETFHPATPAPASSATTTGTASAGAPGSGIGTSTGSDAGTGSGSGTGAGASGGTIDHIRTSIQSEPLL